MKMKRNNRSVKIEKREVKDSDINSFVTYTDPYSKVESRGTISSFTDVYIWIKFKSPSGERCNPNYLKWG